MSVVTSEETTTHRAQDSTRLTCSRKGTHWSDEFRRGVPNSRLMTHGHGRNPSTKILGLNAGVGCIQAGWLTVLDRCRWPSVAFGFLCVLVAAISVHDALLVVVNHDVIEDMEQNPVGCWLLALHGGEVGLFVVVKLATTALVCVLLVELYERWRRGGLLAVAGVAGFQTALLGYLTFM